MMKIMGNGQDLATLDDASFGDFLDRVSRVNVISSTMELSAIFGEAKRRGITIRTHGPLSQNFLDGLVQYNDSALRCDLVRFQWYKMTHENRDYLVNYGNTTVRELIARDHAADLSTVQLQKLLFGPEVGVSIAAYENGFPEEVRDFFEASGLVDPTKLKFGNLVDSDPADIAKCRRTSLGGVDLDDVNEAIVNMLLGVESRIAQAVSLEAR